MKKQDWINIMRKFQIRSQLVRGFRSKEDWRSLEDDWRYLVDTWNCLEILEDAWRFALLLLSTTHSFHHMYPYNPPPYIYFQLTNWNFRNLTSTLLPENLFRSNVMRKVTNRAAVIVLPHSTDEVSTKSSEKRLTKSCLAHKTVRCRNENYHVSNLGCQMRSVCVWVGCAPRLSVLFYLLLITCTNKLH